MDNYFLLSKILKDLDIHFKSISPKNRSQLAHLKATVCKHDHRQNHKAK